jgi:hypothetical protein
MGGRMRHLPGGVDEYLRLRASGAGAGARPADAAVPVRPAAPVASVSGAERRAAEKELASVERRMAKVADGIRTQHDAFAAADQSDYALLQRLQAELAGLEAESTQLENRWLELSELLEG